MKKLIAVFLASFAIFIFADTIEAALSCQVSSGSCANTTVLKMSATTNAHAELPSQANYNYYVCCSGVSGLGNSCSGNYDIALKLSSATNAHVEQSSYVNYSNNVCLSAPAGYTVDCDYASDCSNLGSDYVCLASMSGGTNAHVGGCTAYSTKVCCKAVALPPSFDFSISINPVSGSITEGGWGTLASTVTVTLISGTTQSVTFTASNLPSGTSASFSPNSCNPTCTSTMTLSTTPSTPIGSYSINVCGTGGSQTHCVIYGLTITPLCDNDGVCDFGSGERYSNCPQDCCKSTCTGCVSAGTPAACSSDSICHSVCNGYNGCSLTPGCNGVNSGSTICYDAERRATCCKGSPIDCGAEYWQCCNGNCGRQYVDYGCSGSSCWGPSAGPCQDCGVYACSDGSCTTTCSQACGADCDEPTDCPSGVCRADCTCEVPGINPPIVTNNDGASNMTIDSARLSGEVVDTGGENPYVYFYWGDNDGGTTAGSWDNQAVIPDSPSQPQGTGIFYKDITGLSLSTTYYYRAYATSSGGDDWADNTEIFTTESIAPSCADHNVWGWAWSENIGWISFSCTNTAASVGYGVDIDPDTGVFSGYAWSENIGWISFEMSDLVGCPSGIGTCEARLATTTGRIYGWAKALVSSDGWDGWISLSNINYNYGVWVDYSPDPSELKGWAWGDEVIGWISFNCANQNVCLTSPYKAMTSLSFVISNYPPSATNFSVVQGDYCFAPYSPIYLSWQYSDPDNIPSGADLQTAYQVQISNNSDFTSIEDDSGKVSSSGTEYAPIGLSYDTTYYWRVRVWDSHDTISECGNPDGWCYPFPLSFNTQEEYPRTDFSWSPSQPATGELIEFTDETEYYYPANNWDWDFGDGNTTTTQNPTYSYSDEPAGEGYEVIFTACDVNNHCCSAPKTIGVELPLPDWREIPPF